MQDHCKLNRTVIIKQHVMNVDLHYHIIWLPIWFCLNLLPTTLTVLFYDTALSAESSVY